MIEGTDSKLGSGELELSCSTNVGKWIFKATQVISPPAFIYTYIYMHIHIYIYNASNGMNCLSLLSDLRRL